VDFDDRVKTGNVTSIWAVKLYNDQNDPSDTYFGIATSEYDDGQYHYPIVKNKPSIRTSINLAKSTAKTSDVTLTCINEYLPSKLLSEELLYGTYHYINQEVKIYQCFDDDNNVAQVQIYTGRLVDISHDHETCTLKVQSARPWDFISFPNQLSTTRNVYFPAVYGWFQYNTSTFSSPQITTGMSKALFPIPKDEYVGEDVKFLVHEDMPTDGTDVNARGHFYDERLDAFLPFDPIDDTPEAQGGGACINVTDELKRAFIIGEEHCKNGSGNDWDFEDVFSGSYTYESFDISGHAVSHQHHIIKYLVIELYKPDGHIRQVDVSFDIDWDGGSASFTGSGINQCRVIDQTSGSDVVKYTNNYENGISESTTISSVTTSAAAINTITFKIDSEILCTGSSGQYINVDIGIRNLAIAIEVIADISDETEAVSMRINDLNFAYCGANGFGKSGTTTSGWAIGSTIDELHEAHKSSSPRVWALEL